jgi:hypothetical protein
MPDTFLWVGTSDSTTTATTGGWNVAANWYKNGVASATLPAAGDYVFFSATTADIAVGPNTNNTSIVYLGSLNFDQSWEGSVPSAGLNIGAAKVNIGYHYGSGSPSGSPRIRLNLSAAPLTTNASHASTIVVFNTSGSSDDLYKEPVRILCSNAASTLEVRKGSVGVATSGPEESATINKVQVGYVDNVASDAAVTVGAGVTVTSFIQTGGANLVQCSPTTVSASAGTLTLVGTGTIASLSVGKDATVYPDGTLTLTAVENSGIIDMMRSSGARAVTGITLYDGATFKADADVVTLPTATSGTATLTLKECRIEDVTLDLGRGPVLRAY